VGNKCAAIIDNSLDHPHSEYLGDVQWLQMWHDGKIACNRFCDCLFKLCMYPMLIISSFNNHTTLDVSENDSRTG